MIELNLFISFFTIGIGAYGGGIAAIPLIEHEMVVVHNWLSYSEMSELVAVAQITPGPIAVNAATFAGYMAAGFTGALVATVAVITPSVLLCTLLILFLKRLKKGVIEDVRKSVTPAVLGLIMSAVWIYGRNAITDLPSLGIAITSFVLLILLRERVQPVLIILLGGFAGVFFF